MDEPLYRREGPHYFQLIHVLYYIDMFKIENYYEFGMECPYYVKMNSKICRIVRLV